ncbi:hypothetical protein [Trichocoleus sp. DQ-U1]|uniref:hypothetical protein n=1 Tax=Trichocoleus sp. DQ-U1 TaxID=2933926 RepID=UPI003297C550
MEEAAFARRQLYVAMTRAQDELHLFGNGNATILNELQQSQKFEVVRDRAAILWRHFPLALFKHLEKSLKICIFSRSQ